MPCHREVQSCLGADQVILVGGRCVDVDLDPVDFAREAAAFGGVAVADAGSLSPPSARSPVREPCTNHLAARAHNQGHDCAREQRTPPHPKHMKRYPLGRPRWSRCHSARGLRHRPRQLGAGDRATTSKSGSITTTDRGRGRRCAPDREGPPDSPTLPCAYSAARTSATTSGGNRRFGNCPRSLVQRNRGLAP